MEGEGGSPSDRPALLRPPAEGGGATRLSFLHLSDSHRDGGGDAGSGGESHEDSSDSDSDSE